MSHNFTPHQNGLILRDLPGKATCQIEGPASLTNALLSRLSSPPDATLTQPMHLNLDCLPGSGVAYPLWAFWLPPDIVWEPRFNPLQSWRAQLPPARRRMPFLVLAKAQGTWDLQEMFSTQFSHLLQERDPLGTPNGRILAYAPLPPAPLGDSLAHALITFLHTLSPRSEATLPEATFVVRSGVDRVHWDLPFPATLFVRKSRHGYAATTQDPPSLRVPIPHGLRVQAQWQGPFVWGAWRAEQQQERFLSLGVRGAAPLHGGLSIHFAREGVDRARIHAAISRSFLSAPISRETSNQTVDRALRGIERNFAEDFEIGATLDSAYGNLLRFPVSPPLPLSQAITLPEPPPFDPIRGESLDDDAAPRPLPPDGLQACLQILREAQATIGNRKQVQRSAERRIRAREKRAQKASTKAA